MPRLGELLVATGLLTAEQVEQALRAQVMWGGRIGTNIIELGFMQLDELSVALGRQHRMPAALAKHFDRADARVQDRLSPDVAERFSVVPLLRAGQAKLQVIVASIAPLEERGIAIVADELAVDPEQIIPAIAAELRIRYHLERVYKIPRGTRFLRSRGKTVPPYPQFEVVPVPPESEPDLVLPPTGGTGQLPVVPMDAEIHSEPIELGPGIITPRTLTPVRGSPPGRNSSQEIASSARPETERGVGPIRSTVPPPAFDEPSIDVSIARTDTDRDAEQQLDDDRDEVVPTQPLQIVDHDAAVPTQPLHVVDSAPIIVEIDEGVADLSTLAELDDSDDVAEIVSPVPELDEPGRERRKYVPTITEMPASDTERHSLGRIAIRRVAVTASPATASTLGEATRSIRRASDRDKVADLAIAALDRFVATCDAAVLLIVRGEVAIGWKSFCRAGATIPEVGVPLDQPGIVPEAMRHGALVRRPAQNLGPIDQLLLVSLGQKDGDLAVVPITIADQVMCLIALVARPDSDISSADSIAAAAGAAFARLMRDASR